MSQYQSKSEEIHPAQSPVDDDVTKDDGSSLKVIESHVLQERTIGIFGGVSLITNKIIGSGIFSTPSTILRLAGSPGMALMCWVIGGIIATTGTLVFLEFGTAIPRSGGIKNYLERSFSPRLMQTCIYVFYCIFLQVSASNAITFSSYILISAGGPSTTWLLRGVAIASAVFCVAIHTVARRWGRGLQDALAAVKLFVLFFIICCGFAALNGKLRIDKPDNFTNAFVGTRNNGYNLGTAILNVIFSFGGYEIINAVLSEVRNPQRTLKIALPLAMGTIGLLYILTKIAYLAAVPTADFLNSNVTAAATLFKNSWATRPAERSSLHSSPSPPSVTFSVLLSPFLSHPPSFNTWSSLTMTARLIQELAKDGVLPFSDFMMENRLFKTPIFALILHLGVTVLFICAPPAGDAFNFIVSLSSYPTTVLNLALTIGLIKLRLTKKEAWSAPFSAPWIAIAVYLLGNTFLTAMPFVRPPNGKVNTSLPYCLSSVVALAILSLGIIYYTLRFVLSPRFIGYRHTTCQQELSDGSTVTRFTRVKNL